MPPETPVKTALILSNLRAEGGPALAADLAAVWNAQGRAAPVALLLNDDDMTMRDRFDALSVPIVNAAVGPVTPKRYPAIAWRMRHVFRTESIGAIVSIPNGVHGALFAGAALEGIRQRVVHLGNYPWHWQPDFWKYRLLMRASAPLTPDLVCVTEHVAQGAREHFGSVAKNVHVVCNGIDLSAFAFRGDPRPTKAPKVVIVARIDSGKDHANLIDAIGLLRALGIAATLDIVGEGSLRESLEAQVAKAGLAEAVRFLGRRRDIPDLLRAADVFAFSVRPEEGLGIALIEAMAVGVPIVATDVGACREVLDGGGCGALVPENDPQALADAIARAATAPDAAQVRAARERAEKVYSQAAMADGYARILGI
ncbi:MAG: glycosyltransferase [Maritimibacter sp.]|uniref:glycosyltransferase n=1 Tax=Maritimibacter sp. TaxID=2003363 RepID=UPI001DA318AD|nr:glycosyltransferase [Maritimibacter sp.]MBL6427636.1 glycosyltransferase [Maritimibacter sp.]